MVGNTPTPTPPATPAPNADPASGLSSIERVGYAIDSGIRDTANLVVKGVTLGNYSLDDLLGENEREITAARHKSFTPTERVEGAVAGVAGLALGVGAGLGALGVGPMAEGAAAAGSSVASTARQAAARVGQNIASAIGPRGALTVGTAATIATGVLPTHSGAPPAVAEADAAPAPVAAASAHHPDHHHPVQHHRPHHASLRNGEGEHQEHESEAAALNKAEVGMLQTENRSITVPEGKAGLVKAGFKP